MREAVIDLSPRAFKLLNLIYYGHISHEYLMDAKASKILGCGINTYANTKYELKESDYLLIHQLPNNKFIWIIGKKAIAKDKDRWNPKSRSQHQRLAKEVFDEQFPF